MHKDDPECQKCFKLIAAMRREREVSRLTIVLLVVTLVIVVIAKVSGA